MKVLFIVPVLCAGMAGAAAQGLPAHCQDAAYRHQLRAIGPMVSVGASTSSGMLAKSFPLMAANQLCLDQGSGYASLHTFGAGSKFPFLKKDGFPVQTEIGGMINTVTKVERKSTSRSAFDVPAGYKKAEQK